MERGARRGDGSAAGGLAWRWLRGSLAARLRGFEQVSTLAADDYLKYQYFSPFQHYQSLKAIHQYWWVVMILRMEAKENALQRNNHDRLNQFISNDAVLPLRPRP
jgi:hypothetical protein